MYDRILNNVKRFIELNDEETNFFISLLSSKKIQ